MTDSTSSVSFDWVKGKTPLLDLNDFNDRVVGGYNAGTGETGLPADISTARSLIAPGTGALRDFSYIAPDIPVVDNQKCVGCMECVVECPDTAILGKVALPEELDRALAQAAPEDKERFASHWSKTKKYHDVPEKKGGNPGLFGIFVDPTKCKGCAECVEVCSDDALKMVPKAEAGLDVHRRDWAHYNAVPDTPQEFISERILSDMMLDPRAINGFVGGAGSCMGCGEVTALRMMLAATNFTYGEGNIGLVAATGCNTVYGSTYPFNPYTVPWMNSLFENAAITAAGVRLRWDQRGWGEKKLWAIGGDGAMLDIGFQPLSRVLTSNLDVNTLVLDTQTYSNTGGQASTATFTGQNAKLSVHGSSVPGKQEARKELAQIAMMHPNVFVAQTTPAHINHFYRSIMAANEYPGPSIVIAYTACQPEHGIADDLSSHQAKFAVDSRAFPLLVHDPRNGDTLKERLSLKGNPALKADWATKPKSEEPLTFLDFARTEGRFAKQFDTDGNASETLVRAEAERLANWRQLQEMAGLI